MISSQKLWTLDHEAGQIKSNTDKKMYSVSKRDTVEWRHKKGETIEHL
jgi:endonuclease YncB( thermonuclease family)